MSPTPSVLAGGSGDGPRAGADCWVGWVRGAAHVGHCGCCAPDVVRHSLPCRRTLPCGALAFASAPRRRLRAERRPSLRRLRARRRGIPACGGRGVKAARREPRDPVRRQPSRSQGGCSGAGVSRLASLAPQSARGTGGRSGAGVSTDAPRWRSSPLDHRWRAGRGAKAARPEPRGPVRRQPSGGDGRRSGAGVSRLASLAPQPAAETAGFTTSQIARRLAQEGSAGRPPQAGCWVTRRTSPERIRSTRSSGVVTR